MKLRSYLPTSSISLWIMEYIILHRLETVEEFVRTNKQRDELQTKDNSEDLTSPVTLWVRDDLPSALTTCLVTISKEPETAKGYT